MATQATAQAPEITRDFLAAHHPALLTQITEDARTDGYALGMAEGQSAGIATERARVTAILQAADAAPHATSLAHAAITQGLALEQAQAMLAAAPLPATLEQAASAAYRQGFLAEGQHQAPSADSATGDATADAGADPDAAVRHGWDTNATLRQEFGGSFDRYVAFRKAHASGRVRILRTERAAALAQSAQ